eukprot:6880918-Prymnesium_polylepis.1
MAPTDGTALAALAAAAATTLLYAWRRRSPPPADSDLPDVFCDCCMSPIGSQLPRYHCAAPSCDNFHACCACAALPATQRAHQHDDSLPSGLSLQSRSSFANIISVFQGTSNGCLLYTSPSPRDAHES